MEVTKEKLTFEQVKERFPDNDWDGVKLGDEYICVGVPNTPAVRRFLSESADTKAALTANMNLVKSCLLTHTPAEFEKLVDSRPGILGTLVTKVVKLADAGVEDLKK